MPLRKSPVRSPALLAANRANARKSTGPRTPSGKARVSLNALKHGRSMGPAGRAPRFRERLLRAGYPEQEALYGGLRSCLAQAFGARSPRWRRQVDEFAASAWCVVMGRSFFRTKPEYPLDLRAEALWVLSQELRKGLVRSLRYRAEDPWRRIGVAFWLQRRRYPTRVRAKRMFQGLEPVSLGPANEGLNGGLESRVRCLVFRLRRPGCFERWQYSLDWNGDPDWSCEPWRSLPHYREGYEKAKARRLSRQASGQASSCTSRPAASPAATAETEQRCSPGLAFPGPAGTGSPAVSRTKADSARKHESSKNVPAVRSWLRGALAVARRLLTGGPKKRD